VSCRTSALPFYQKFGLDATGDTFIKEGIEYVKMEIQL
jgi:predicted GNAT family N-acyltransferase